MSPNNPNLKSKEPRQRKVRLNVAYDRREQFAHLLVKRMASCSPLHIRLMAAAQVKSQLAVFGLSRRAEYPAPAGAVRGNQRFALAAEAEEASLSGGGSGT